MAAVDAFARQGRIRQVMQILRTYGKFLQHSVELLDGELFLRGRWLWLMRAQNLKSDDSRLDTAPSGFCRVHGDKLRVELDLNRKGDAPVRSLSVIQRSNKSALCGRGRPGPLQISKITGMIIGRRPVVFWITRFSSTRTFSLTMP